MKGTFKDIENHDYKLTVITSQSKTEAETCRAARLSLFPVYKKGYSFFKIEPC